MKQESSGSAAIPQPRFKLPFIGHLHYLKSNLSESFINLSSKLGPIYRLKLAQQDLIVVTSSDLIREISDETRFSRINGPFALSLKKTFNTMFAFLSTTDPLWKMLYRLIYPGFQQKMIEENYLPLMKDTLEILFNKWDNRSEKYIINLSDEMRRLVLDTVGVCEFNFNFSSLISEKPLPIPLAINNIISYAVTEMILPKSLMKLQFRKNKEFQNNVSLLYMYAEKIIEERKKNPDSSRKDLLYFLLYEAEKVTGKKLDDFTLMNQVLGILFASISSTSALLIISFYALLTNPDTLEKTYLEIDSILGTDVNRPINLQNISKLVYVRQVINECLRLWSPSLMERSPLENTLMGEKYLVKKGEVMWVTTAVLNKDKALWGDNPNMFNPDRFAPDIKRDHWSFLPFGVGQRACIGRLFAIYLVTLNLAMILQRYRLHLSPNTKVDVEKIGSEAPPTLFVTLEKRMTQKPATLK